MTNSEIADLEARLHDERGWLLGKYDSGAVSAAVFSVVKQIETDLAWLQHRLPTDARHHGSRPNGGGQVTFNKETIT